MRYMLLFTALLGACASYGNTDPDEFRREYDVVCAVVACRYSLYDYDFTIESDRTKGRWVGLVSEGAGDAGQVYLPTIPADRCAVRPATGYEYAHAVIHELLHGQGYVHGDAMWEAQADAWAVYAERWCQR